MQEEIKTLLTGLGIEYQEGSDNLRLRCPLASVLHENGVSNSNSFAIYPESGICKCYRCGYQSDPETLFENIANLRNISIDFENISSLMVMPKHKEEIDNVILRERILSNFEIGHPEIEKYLNSRGIQSKNIPFQLYYDARNRRVVQPIRNSKNQLIGATGRHIGDNPVRSLHYFGVRTGRALLGLEKSDADVLLIVEGLSDLWNAYDNITQLGLSMNVFATLGCKLSDWQAMQIIYQNHRQVLLTYDQDAAGVEGTKKARNKLQDETYFKWLRWSNPKIDMGNASLSFFEDLVSKYI